jgi:hypothetical protein
VETGDGDARRESPRIETRSSRLSAEATIRFDGPRGETRLKIRIASGSNRAEATLVSPFGRAAIALSADSFSAPLAAVGAPFASHPLTTGVEAPYAQRFATISARGETTALLFSDVVSARLTGSTLRCSPRTADFRFAVTFPSHSPASPTEAVALSAAAFGAPIRIARIESHAGELPPLFSFLSIEPGNVLVTAVKPREDGDAGIVIRMVECEGRRTTARLRFGGPPGRSAAVVLLERDVDPLRPDGLSLEVELLPFAVRSVRVDGNPFGADSR